MLWLDGAAMADGYPDRGLEFGDGLFETLAVVDGRLRLLERHLARLSDGCGRLGLAAPDEDICRRELLAAARSPGAGVVKLIVTRGRGGGGYVADPGGAVRRWIAALPARVRPASFAEQGVTLRLCTTRLAEQPLLAGMKHLNRLEQVLARREWADPSIPEGLMLDVHGRVISGTMTNVFAVIDEELVTPALTRAGVAGVMRGALLEAFRNSGARVIERDLGPDELGGASEVFVTNALIGAWPVRRCAADAWPVGPWARRAQAWVREW
ncbi:MAG TPA: aminodeoxychorismate lyase [Steroidobacteraceae bacterium]|nr:aminodeoxychorismate lyase [Steroidobacteraceae bacterium]